MIIDLFFVNIFFLFRHQRQVPEPEPEVPQREVPLYRLPRGLRRRAKEEKREDGKSTLKFQF